MTALGEIISPSLRDALVKQVAQQPDCGCAHTKDGYKYEGGRFIHHGCGRPRPAVANLRGAVGQAVTVPCAGNCGSMVTVTVRKAPTQHADRPRLPVCKECAHIMLAGKTGETFTPAGRTAPAGAPQAIHTQESNVPPIDLDTLTDAELGAQVRKAAKQSIAADLPEKREKAKKAKKAKERKADKDKRAESADRSKIGVLPGFTLEGVEVPALDVGDINDLDVAVHKDVRSPYNKVRYRLKMSPLPNATAKQLKEDPTTPQTTWATLVNAHMDLAARAGNVAEAVAEIKAEKKAKPAKKKHIAAHIDLDEKARINVLREQFGVNKKTAQRMLAEIGA